MSTETLILHISWLMEHYKRKRIGSIVDQAPSHSNDEMNIWIKRLNKEHAVYNIKIFIKWIDKGLTSMYQPGDVAMNKPLKDRICALYYRNVSETMAEGFQPRQKIKVSHKKLLEFIKKAFASINQNQKRSFSIYKSFNMCGLNPWGDEKLEHFKAHLDSLSQNSLHATLLKNGKPSSYN